MGTEGEQRRLAAILVADVVGYSSQIGADEAGALARLRSVRDVTDALIAEHQGRIFKTTGDGFLAEFPSAVQALRCAIAIQTGLGKRPESLKLRMGLHQGDVVAQDGDLLGDGVNIAARLEPLAEAGGICISARVREDAIGKIALDVSDLGEQVLKNIDRPIRVYRVRLEPAERPALALPDKPSIAVLPFLNMSGDAEQEYFADGMVEEIITALSRVRWFFVIARNSSFAYKGKSPDVRQVARELGVRYVLEGSVRKAGGRIRITGQLVDALTGAHIWADRFDGTLDDVFDLQDRVTASVVAAVEPKLRSAEIERAQRKPPGSLQAYDLLLRAQLHRNSHTQEGMEEAIRLLRQATEIDPLYALAFAYMAHCEWWIGSQSLMARTRTAGREAVRLVKIAMEHGADDPEVLWLAALMVGLPGGDLSAGIALTEKSISLNANSAAAFQMAGVLHAYAGDTETAIAHLERAVRLNPLDQRTFANFGFALAHFVAGRYEGVLDWTEKALRESQHYAPALRYRAASLGLLGRTVEGRQVAQTLLAVIPDLTVSRARAYIEVDLNNVFKTPGVVDLFCEGLRRAGLPEA
ncbi:MAG: adenylate/guanylate cyclase domain-containing protein [Acetobacteraceae bacterium]